MLGSSERKVGAWSNPSIIYTYYQGNVVVEVLALSLCLLVPLM